VKRAEPRFCITCGVNRRAKAGTRHCYKCVPGGPFTPPPCQRCGTTEDFFSSGLCARCHLHGTIRVDACPDCHAWGTTRRGGWLCRGCEYWRRSYSTNLPCRVCTRTLTVNRHEICRLCWRNAKGHRLPDGAFDPIGGNRNGQQLFFADMQKAATVGQRTPDLAAATLWPAGRPVTHRQPVLFDLPHDVSRGRLPLPAPGDFELAAALDAVAVEHGRQKGWTRPATWKVRSGIRVLLGLQDTPGAPIRHSETSVLPPLFIAVRPVLDVLDSVGMFEDDRTSAIERWFPGHTEGLPPTIRNEIDVWFNVMLEGPRTPPRRQPRSQTTIRIYVQAAMPAIRRWADAGHESLREITRAQVLAALASEPARRKTCGQAMRSIFGVLKSRKLIFINPAVRLDHGTDSPIPPPAVDLDAVRAALKSTDPARACLTALVAYHGLRAHQLRNLKLTDIRDRRLHLDGRDIPLAEPVRRRVAAWLDHRNERWPDSTNPHLFIHFRSAHRQEPAGERWIYLTLALAGGVQALRADRILHEATASGGDARRLSDLFGLGIQQATRYTDAIAEPGLP
jgi:hypothetical protein